MAVATMRPKDGATDIGINAKSRKDVAQSLARTLAGTYLLQLKTQYYHWNVTGGNFHSLHELFNEQYEELSGAVDELAERIRALGVSAPGTFQEFSAMSSLTEDRSLPGTWGAMVNNLLAANEEVAREIRERIKLAQKSGDEGTADLFIKRIQAHEKAAWMLRSHL